MGANSYDESRYLDIKSASPNSNSPEDDFVADRQFQLEQLIDSKKTNWWNSTTNEEITFAAHLFFTKIEFSPMAEAKSVLEVAQKLRKCFF